MDKICPLYKAAAIACPDLVPDSEGVKALLCNGEDCAWWVVNTYQGRPMKTGGHCAITKGEPK